MQSNRLTINGKSRQGVVLLVLFPMFGLVGSGRSNLLLQVELLLRDCTNHLLFSIIKMASYLASIYGTEQDRVNCSFYYKVSSSSASCSELASLFLPLTFLLSFTFSLSPHPDRSLSSRRSMFKETHQTSIQSDNSGGKRLSEPKAFRSRLQPD